MISSAVDRNMAKGRNMAKDSVAVRNSTADRGAAARGSAGAAMVVLIVALMTLWPAVAGATTPPVTPSSAAAGSQPAPVTGSQISWGVAPAPDPADPQRAHFEYTLAPGGTVTDALLVSNHSSNAIQLKVYAGDAFTTSSGGLDLAPSEAKPVDVGAWISLKTPSVTVKPGAVLKVPFTLTVPANATPGDHAGGVVTSLIDTTSSSGVRVDHRLGSRVYVRVSGAVTPALTVAAIQTRFDGTLNPFSAGTAQVTYTVRNTGNVRLAAHQAVQVAGPFGSFAQSVPVADLPELLPGDALTETVVVPGVWPTFVAKATVALTPIAGSGDPAVSAQPVTASDSAVAIPWGQLVLLLILIGLVLALIAVRRRRRRQVDLAISQAVEAALTQAGADSGSSGPTAGSSTS